MSEPDPDQAEKRRVGLCFACAQSKRVVSGRGSAFYLCRDPNLTKYPPLPVVRCSGFAPIVKPAS